MFAQITRAAGKRFASTAASKAPNAFVAEREAVKQHAAETATNALPLGLWLKISIYACIPFIGLSAANAYRLWNDHWEHWSHLPPLEERTEYPFQNIRTKNFPWGNGDETLFWNPAVNYHDKNKVK
uniref:Cytochrome c oxidase subunit 13, mitochondrial n=1 Tax=Thielaviopsis punctulata TaxID=72032 RepID=A0A288R8X6_9PEZI|nr:putative cytochrome c oxidase subunit VIa [Thielaviopsis punctulata]DAB41618.1 TPA_exp: cytochrome c oxidase protein subunit VIa [Thielaviopsis punctulata]